MAMAEKQQAAGAEVKEQQAAAGEVQPAAALTTQDKFHWQMNDIRRLREEGDRIYEALMAEIKALREDGNKHHEESKRRHEQFLEGFHSLEKPVARMEKPVARQFHNSQKQIWILPTIAVALILATGDPENPIVNLLFWLFGIV